MIPRHRVVCCLLAVALSATAARADWLETAGPPLDQDWTFKGLAFDQVSPSAFNQTLVGGQLHLDAVANPPAGTLVAFGYVGGDTFTDARITAEVASDSNNFYGVALRGNGVNTGYIWVINPHLGHAEIVRLSGGANEIATSNSFDTSAGSFYLVFDAIGTALTGYVYDAPGGNLLASASVNDATLAAGVAGIFAAWNEDVPAFAGDDIDAFWDNINVTAPTPAALPAGLALLAAATIRRRR